MGEQWSVQHREACLSLPKDQLLHIRQVSDMLMMGNKDQLLESEMRKDICSALSESLIAQLLENYSTDDLDTVGFPYASVRAIKYSQEKDIDQPSPDNFFTPTLWSSALTAPAHGMKTLVARSMDPSEVPKELRESLSFAFLFE
eukprot:NODE_6288_length_519_cov_64.331915_g5520_i0.p1 GENE.NODE_6288_length_519_cov_64.331915_g5520_i0~~NODE_6288_length_519_cov_64.331915_g5520_i0.p1  ORF type:complete len:152 (-),score=50.03 NODE_6288_length_519_cov_64.331915_g5520_i0:62-493(-)